MRRFRSVSDDEGSEAAIDISPLIDCVFILLIFFIVTTSFVEEKGIEAEKAQSSASSSDLSSTAPLLFLVRSDRKVMLDGREISLGAIQPEVRRSVQRDPKTPVIVQVAQQADSGLMIRVVDEAKLAGAGKVNVTTE
jgi:biopolymer transport protein ExbD